MAEYIKKDELLKFKANVYDEDGHVLYAVPTGCILAMPPADVMPVRHGRWIDAYTDIEPNPMFMYGICSECGFEQGISKYLIYCPNCCAKMDGGDNKIDNV